jgi:tyrosyl-DNA phosphodiesterase 2
MNLFSHVRTEYLSWSNNTPLRFDEPDAAPTFQRWHEFDAETKRWSHVNHTSATRNSQNSQNIQKYTKKDSQIELVTWNVDSTSAMPESRMSAIISNILEVGPSVDIIFLQEVPKAGLAFLLGDSRIQESWISSDADESSWTGQSFATMTLLSKSRFVSTQDRGTLKEERYALGPIWRVKYPSRFGRDALCCDFFIKSTRVRLINVHLDSLAINLSNRPRQISTIASLLRSAERGLVAGDFNPVLPEDETLIQKNHLEDAWAALRPEESGFTWGVDGKQPFPASRMDKIATLGLKVQSIEVIHPGFITRSGIQIKPLAENPSSEIPSTDDEEYGEELGEEMIPWSDHSGLRCFFVLRRE